jgi:hypothetical protein
MHTIYNERVKLLASALNSLCVATLATALLGPSVAILYGTSSAAANGWWFLIGVLWLFVGFGLHVIASAILGRLRP